MRALLRKICECQAELGGIARIVEVSFVSFKFVRYGGHYGICMNVKMNHKESVQSGEHTHL